MSSPQYIASKDLDVDPLVDIPTKHYSSVSVKLLHPDQDRIENAGLNVSLAEGDIDLNPPQNEAFGYLINQKWYRKVRGIFLVSTYSRVHGSLFRSEYGVYQERARHLASYPWIIHPYSTFRWCWDILMSICLVLTLIAQPVVITFYYQRYHEKAYVVVSVIQGAMFLVDILLNFRTGYISMHNDTIILDGRRIVWRYFKTWFLIDLLSTIPYDAIFVLLQVKFGLEMGGKAFIIFKYIRFLELVKIFRLVRVIRYFTRIQEAFMIDSVYIRVINLYIIMFFTLHWDSCLHYLVADLFNPKGSRQDKSWVTLTKLWDAPVWKKYINSMIRALSNMACLGYGSDVPKTSEDIVCTIFSIMVGATFFALFIGNLSSILINVDVAQKKYAEVLNQVMEYMRFKQIPKDLQNRVVLYYEHRYRRNYFNENNILSSISDVLRQEIQMFNCRRLVEAVPLFNGIPVTIVQSIVGRLQFEVYLPHDVIIGANTIGDCMYFIEHGSVSILAPNGKSIARLRDGDFFGELALITNERRNATVVATAYCDMYRLERDDFEDTIKGYPEVYKQLAKFAEERVVEKVEVGKEDSTTGGKSTRTLKVNDINDKSEPPVPHGKGNKKKKKQKGGNSVASVK